MFIHLHVLFVAPIEGMPQSHGIANVALALLLNLNCYINNKVTTEEHHEKD